MILMVFRGMQAQIIAQNSAEKLLSLYEGRFSLMDSLLFGKQEKNFSGFYKSTFTKPERIDEIDAATDAKINAMKGKVGLEISGQAYYRPGKGIGYDPDDALSAYNMKGQGELQWHIFQSSLYKWANKIRELRLQGDIAQLDLEKQAIARTLVEQKLHTRSHYDAMMVELLQYHTDNLSLLTETQTYLLQGGKISSDDLLKLLSEKAEIDRQLIAIQSDTSIHRMRPTMKVVRVIVDTTALLNHIRMYHHDLVKMDLQMELLDCRRAGIDYLQKMSVSPFVRYAWYHRPDISNSRNIDIGITFKIPLFTETMKERKALSAEKEVVKYQQKVLQEQFMRETNLLLLELNRYNESIRGEQERLSQLLDYMRMRNYGYENRVGEYNRLSKLMEYNACLSSWEKLLGYEYQRDCKLIDLQSFVMDCPLSDFLTIIEE